MTTTIDGMEARVATIISGRLRWRVVHTLVPWMEVIYGVTPGDMSQLKRGL